MPDSSHVGRRYTAVGQVIDADQARAFATAIGGDALAEPDAVPPTFAAVYALYPTLFQLFADSEVGVNLAGLIHGEQSFRFPTPVAPGDVVDATAEIASVDEKRGMTFLTLEIAAIRQSDQTTVCTGRSLMIIRGGG